MDQIALNLRDERAVEILRSLATEADVFLQNFRPGVAGRLGIDYDDLSALNPELIYVSISGFGQTGPYANQPVYDPIVQGISGAASAQGGDFIKSIAADVAGQFIRELQPEVDALFVTFHTDDRRYSFQYFRRAETDFFQIKFAGFDFGKIEDIVD